jgi:two-component system NarL family sensor kinase
MFEKVLLPLVIAQTLLAVIFVFFMVFSVILLKNKQNRRKREHLLALIEEKERTMSDISVELHDNIVQMLHVARMNVYMLEDVTAPEHLKITNQVGKILQRLIDDTHNISHVLNPDYLRGKGLVSSLKEKVEWVNSSGRLSCELEVLGAVKFLPPQSELMIFRIAQEAINNALKYAKAAKLLIRLEYDLRDFKMLMEDNGAGFNCQCPDFQEGLGIRSMRQRAMLTNGVLSIESAPGKGTTVRLEIADVFKPAGK